MVKKVFLSLILCGIIIVTSFFIYKKYTYTPPVHYHAGFQIYINGKLQDYSSTEFMHLKPCGAHDSTEDQENVQLEKAHLHDNVGDVIHVHRNDVVWNDVFTNLKVQIPTASVSAYMNGKKIVDIKRHPVKAYDSLVLMIGKEDKTYLNNAVTLTHIKQSEKKSESCGS